MRVGKVTKGDHPVLAKDVHIGYSTRNKINKILLRLHTSKTYGKESYPQEIKISQSKNCAVNQAKQRCFCPFDLFNQYLVFRGHDYETDTEQFFVFSDKSPVTIIQFCTALRELLTRMGLDAKLYDTHSFRGGCCVDLYKGGMNFQELKRAGRWQSNMIYKYLQAW